MIPSYPFLVVLLRYSRYGLNNLRGYYEYHSQLTADFQQTLVRGKSTE